MILFGLRDIGSGNACLPTVKKLKDMGIPVSVYAEGAAHERFKDEFQFITECKIEDLFSLIEPTLVVATTAQVGGNVPINLIDHAKRRNLPVVLVEDVWSSHSAYRWDIFPDGVCVMDEFAKKLILRSWPDYSESNIYITGMPVFDKFTNTQTESTNHELREMLGLCEDWPIIFFPGQGQAWGVAQSISMLIEALNGFDVPMYLIFREHPNFALSSSSFECRQVFCEHQDILKKLTKGKTVDSGKFDSGEVCRGSDIVVGINSTMTVEACYMHKSVLTIWTPEIGQALLRATNNSLIEWPIASLGASLRAENAQEIRGCLRKIITGDTASMLQAQRNHFQADGFSSDRIAKAILGHYK